MQQFLHLLIKMPTQKSTIFLGYFCKRSGCPRTFKNRPIWSHYLWINEKDWEKREREREWTSPSERCSNVKPSINVKINLPKAYEDWAQRRRRGNGSWEREGEREAKIIVGEAEKLNEKERYGKWWKKKIWNLFRAPLTSNIRKIRAIIFSLMSSSRCYEAYPENSSLS